MGIADFLPAIEGFLLGAGLIVAIGSQNAFILRQGLRREHVFILTTICFLSDALLIATGVAGMGTLIASNPIFTKIAAVGGSLFLIIYGVLAFKAALKPGALKAAEEHKPYPVMKAVSLVLALTFLNPHVYLDTVVMMGSIAGQYPVNERLLFGLGGVSASAVWFYGLGYGAALLEPLFAKPIAWRVLDGLIGLIMWAIAYGLVRSLIL